MEKFLIISLLAVGLIYLIYKLSIAIKNIFIGSKEIVKHSAEFTNIVAKLGKKRIDEKINQIKLKYEVDKQIEDFIVTQIMLEFNVDRIVAKDIYKYYFQ